MHTDWKMGLGREDASPDRHMQNMRSTLQMHRELVAQKAEIREQPDALTARLEAMGEELEPYDTASEAIQLLLEAEQVRAMQFEELDMRLDQLTESFMAGSIGLLEQLRPPGA